MAIPPPPALPWRKTPLLESAGLSRAAGCRVHLKLENLQPAGSFKSRGIGYYMLARLREHSDRPDSDRVSVHFYSSSGGNAGLAAVHAAVALKLPCTVVVPLTTQPRMIEKMKIAGASEVVQMGASWQEADEYLRKELLGKNAGGVYVPPFDHPDVWAGHAGMIEEIVEQLAGTKPKAIVCSVGGGGLFSGLQLGLEKAGWENVPVVAMETIGTDCFSQSIKAKSLVTLPKITSKARCLGARRCAGKALELGLRPNVRSAVVTDEVAARACLRLANEERLIVELACGVNVAVCYEDGMLARVLDDDVSKDDVVVVVLCGGSDVDLDSIQEWRQEAS
ncbi:MAG: hypothetical protein M1828_000135 [Chrysothrix sp. TS-e1954]|nr:MAG: hypothetical protein M1828_000135 [Chrysothrix sp. TS-e1954]